MAKAPTMINGKPVMTVSQISRRMIGGAGITARLLSSAGVHPVAQISQSTLYPADQYPEIARRVCATIMAGASK